MDTSLEAVLRALLNGDIVDASNGDVESPTGYFGRIHIEYDDIEHVLSDVEYVINDYGRPTDDELIGHWFLSINSDGILSTTKSGAKDCLDMMERYEAEYIEWAGLD